MSITIPAWLLWVIGIPLAIILGIAVVLGLVALFGFIVMAVRGDNLGPRF